jgi:hypothetical protein
MTAAGLVTVSRIGRQRHYQANPASPIFSELRGIAVKTFGLSDLLREALAHLEPEVRAAFVFGSMEKASTALARPVNPTIYTSEEFARRVRENHPLVHKVLDQPRIWIIGNEDDLPT